MEKLYKIVGCNPMYGASVQNGVLTETMTGKNLIILMTIGHARKKAKAFDGTIEEVNQLKINPADYWGINNSSSQAFQYNLDMFTDEVRGHLKLLIKENIDERKQIDMEPIVDSFGHTIVGVNLDEVLLDDHSNGTGTLPLFELNLTEMLAIIKQIEETL